MPKKLKCHHCHFGFFLQHDHFHIFIFLLNIEYDENLQYKNDLLRIISKYMLEDCGSSLRSTQL